MKQSNGNDHLRLSWSYQKIAGFRKSLLKWSAENGRHWIPWKLKKDGTSPRSEETLCIYRIWIAEIMLQQTQLKVVLPYWEKWMKAFPTLVDLAKAEEQKVLLVWQGLGYYSRARRTHQAAKYLLKYIGQAKSIDSKEWPRDLDTWISLPGIGRTTAASILSSAFNSAEPIMDGNIKRILSRIIASPINPNKNLKRLWIINRQILDKKNSRDFNQALMDLGATICTPINPICSICPLQTYCIAYSEGCPSNFPVKETKKQIPYEVIGVGVIINASGEVLIDQRLNKGVLGGMWEFPGGKQEKKETIKKTISRELKEELNIKVEVGDLLIDLQHSYSHKKLRFVVHLCKLIEGEPTPVKSQKVEWVNPKNLDKYPFPAANTKIIHALNSYLKKVKVEEIY